MEQTKSDKFLQIVSNISNNKYVNALSKGMTATLPLTMIGSIALLFTKIPFGPWQNLLASGFDKVFNLPIQFTTNMLAIWAVFLVANNLANRFNRDGVIAGLAALLSFLILTPITTTDEGVNMLSFDWIGAKGVFVALIVAIGISRLYVLIMDKKLYIRMPEGVPPFVEKSFAAVIPYTMIALLSGIIAWGFSLTSFGSIHELIFNILQIPMQYIGGSILGVLAAYVMTNILWLFGIHGKAVMFSVLLPVWQSLTAENLAAAQAGTTAPNIIDLGFTTIFFEIGGAGCVFALAVLMLFFAKSQQYKAFGKVFIVPTFCGISEPIHFGTPLVFNPSFAIPFIAAPLASGTIAYVATAIGLMPRLQGITVPTGTPQFLNGLLIGGIPGLLVQIVCFAACVAIYFPFFKAADKKALNQEKELKKEEEAADNLDETSAVEA